MGKKLLTVFILAFTFNFVWEYLHSALYIHYKGSPITIPVLIRATFFDAVFITLLSFLFLRFAFFKGRSWLAPVIGLVAAIGIEIYALQTGRWTYKDIMPTIPVINTGLTPTIQLAFLSFLIFKIVGI